MRDVEVYFYSVLLCFFLFFFVLLHFFIYVNSFYYYPILSLGYECDLLLGSFSLCGESLAVHILYLTGSPYFYFLSLVIGSYTRIYF
jgi:hypothetical protein